jgi:hypothetical protein
VNLELDEKKKLGRRFQNRIQEPGKGFFTQRLPGTDFEVTYRWCFAGVMGRVRLSLVGEEAATETQDRRQGPCRSQLKDSGVETGIRGLSEDETSHLRARPKCLGWLGSLDL